MYPLFACMVTGRSWNAITTGVDKQQFSSNEVMLLIYYSSLFSDSYIDVYVKTNSIKLINRQECYIPILTYYQEDEIRTGAATYLPEISNILNEVPREMLLIFKTNDLLRGIESTLHTRASASSFITMSKFCIKAVYKHKKRKCTDWMCKFRLSSAESFVLFKLNLYALYLWLRELPVLDKILKRRWSTMATVKQTVKLAEAVAEC